MWTDVQNSQHAGCGDTEVSVTWPLLWGGHTENRKEKEKTGKCVKEK